MTDLIEKVFTGKTVEEAVEIGLSELNLKREEVEIEVLEEGKKKLFGTVPAQVKIIKLPSRSDGERAVDFLKGLFQILGEEVVPSLKEEGEKVVIDLQCENQRTLIGRRGETIDAVQTLASAVANTGRRDYIRVVVDCGTYREDREATLKRVAVKLAEKAVRLGKRVRLEPMNPYERRIIHAALSENTEVTTKSEGKEPSRFVVIIPKNLKTFDKPHDRRRGGRDKYSYRKRDKAPEKKYEKRELPKDSTPATAGTSFAKSSSSGYKKGFSGFFGTYLGNSKESQDETDPQNGSDE